MHLQSANVAGFDPVLISLIRRSMPQPDRIRHLRRSANEWSYWTDLRNALPLRMTRLVPRPSSMKSIPPSLVRTVPIPSLSGFSDGAAGMGTDATRSGTNPGVLNPAGSANPLAYNVGQGMTTAELSTPEMVLLTTSTRCILDREGHRNCKSRALESRVLLRTRTRPQGIHGLNAELNWQTFCLPRFSLRSTAKSSEPSTRLTTRVQLQTLLTQVLSTSTLTPTVVGLLRSSRVFCSKSAHDANAIAQGTRRGKGNTIICSADVASALTMAGVLDYNPCTQQRSNVDDTGNTFAGVLQGKYQCLHRSLCCKRCF